MLQTNGALVAPIRRGIVEAEAASRRTRVRQVTRDRDVPLDLARDAIIVRGRVVRDRVDGHRWRLPDHPEILELGVAEGLERVVADVQHASREAALAGHGELPREVQAAALYPGFPE